MSRSVFMKVFPKPPQNPHFYQEDFHELISREWLNRMTWNFLWRYILTSSTYHTIFASKYPAIKILWIVQYMKIGNFWRFSRWIKFLWLKTGWFMFIILVYVFNEKSNKIRSVSYCRHCLLNKLVNRSINFIVDE